MDARPVRRHGALLHCNRHDGRHVEPLHRLVPRHGQMDRPSAALVRVCAARAVRRSADGQCVQRLRVLFRRAGRIRRRRHTDAHILPAFRHLRAHGRLHARARLHEPRLGAQAEPGRVSFLLHDGGGDRAPDNMAAMAVLCARLPCGQLLLPRLRRRGRGRRAAPGLHRTRAGGEARGGAGEGA